MRATRRRTRTSDPLASPSTIRSICDKFRAQLPEPNTWSEKQLTRFLYAIRHVERRPASDIRRGRPGRWSRETLVKAASQLRLILQRETAGRVSLSSFIGQYIPVLQFPSDVADALMSGRINLQEAAQLARVTPERLNCSSSAAGSARAELLQSHLAVQGSQTRLRARVKEILGESNVHEVSGEGMTAVLAKVDEMLEIDPSDTRHLFWEEMKRFFFAMRDIEPEDLDEEVMNDFLQAMDQVSNVLHRLEKRRQKRKAQRATLTV